EPRSRAMLETLWRRLRNTNPPSPGGPSLREGRHPLCRPCLEALEDRVLPAPMPGWVLPVATPPNTVITLPPISSPPPGAMNPITVTVAANTPKTVIDLGPVVGALGGVQQADGLHLSVLGNTNSGLVKADLSAAKLVLTYVPGKFGEATITVCATFADGVSVQ